MYLTNPTIPELQLLDLPVLVDMLAKQTADYVQLVSGEGFNIRTAAAKESLQNIQAAIESKSKQAGISTDVIPVVLSSPGNDVQGIKEIS